MLTQQEYDYLEEDEMQMWQDIKEAERSALTESELAGIYEESADAVQVNIALQSASSDEEVDQSGFQDAQNSLGTR